MERKKAFEDTGPRELSAEAMLLKGGKRQDFKMKMGIYVP